MMNSRSAATGLHESLEARHEPGGSTDRGFGLVMAAFFAVVALLPLRAGHPARVWALGAAACLLALALARPSLLHVPNLLWRRLGLLLGKVVNPIVLSLMFFLVFTPAGLCLRLAGKDPLRLKKPKDRKSYWIPRDPPGPDPESMRLQF
jgi:hypothetical protein